MVYKAYRAIIVVELSLLVIVLFSLLQCNDYYDDDWICTQASVYTYTNSTLNSLSSYELNPPKLMFSNDGPMDVCPRKNIQIVASLLCKKNPPISINAICRIGTKRILLNNYDSLNHKYTSDTTNYLPFNANQNLALSVGCKFEISWTPLIPYENENELKEFVNIYLDEIEVQYNYYDFKP